MAEVCWYGSISILPPSPVLTPGRVQAQRLDVGRAAAGDHEVVGLDLLVADLDLDAGLLLGNAFDLGAGLDVDAVFLELALDDARHVLVLRGQDLVEHLDERHVDPEPRVGRGDLGAGCAGAGDDKGLRKLLERPGTPGVDHAVGELDPGDRHRDGAGCQDDRLRVVRLAVNLDLAVTGQLSLACQDVDLVLLPEHLDAVGEGLGDGFAALLHGRPVDRDAAGLDAEVGALLGHGREDLGRMQDGLGRDARVVEAAPAWLVALDDGGLLAELRGANRGNVAAGPAADHDRVVATHPSSTL